MPNDVVVPLGVVDRVSGTLSKVENRLKSLDRTQDRLGRTAVRAAERSSRSWGAVRGSLDRVGRAAGRVLGGISSQLQSVIRFSMRWGTIMGGVVAGTLGLIARQGLNLNSQLQKYQITLETVLGSQTKANALISFIINFAARTPFQITGLVETAVQLEAVGLSARRWLPVVGDLASAFGGSQEKVEQLVRALGLLRTGVSGDALETLRKLGISQREFEARGIKFASNRQLISPANEALSALEDIVKTRFGGLMAKLSGTFVGALSNIQDNLTNVLIGTFHSAFTSAEKVARRLLAAFDLLKDSGIIRAIQTTAGDAIAKGFQRAVAEAEKLIGIVESTGGIGAAFKRLWDDIRPAALNFVRWFGGVLASALKGIFLELIKSREGRAILAVGAVSSPAGSALLGAGAGLAGGGLLAGIKKLVATVAGRGASAVAGGAVGAAGAAGGLVAPLSGTILGAGGAAAGGAAATGGGLGVLGTIGSAVGTIAAAATTLPALVILAAGLAAKAGLEFSNARTEAKLTAGAATRTPQADLVTTVAEQNRIRLQGFRSAVGSRFGKIGEANVDTLFLTNPDLFKKVIAGMAFGKKAADEFAEALLKIVGPEVSDRVAAVQQQFLGLAETLPEFAKKAQDSLDIVIGRLEGVGSKLTDKLLDPTAQIAARQKAIGGVDTKLAGITGQIGKLGRDPALVLQESEKLVGLADEYNTALEKRGRLRFEELGLAVKIAQQEAKTAAGILTRFAGLGGREGPSAKSKFIRDLDEAVSARDKLRAGGRVKSTDIVRFSKEFAGLFTSKEVFKAIRDAFGKQAGAIVGQKRTAELLKVLKTEIDVADFQRRKDQIIAESKLMGKGLTDAITSATDRMKDELVEGFRIAGQAAIDKILAQLGPRGQDIGGRLARTFAATLAAQLEEFEKKLKAQNNPTNPAGAPP